jgi:hypothetical protein
VARVTLVISDVQGGVQIRWKGLPCPVHDKPLELFTEAEKFAFDIYRKNNAVRMSLGEFMKHAKNNCPGHDER